MYTGAAVASLNPYHQIEVLIHSWLLHVPYLFHISMGILEAPRELGIIEELATVCCRKSNAASHIIISH